MSLQRKPKKQRHALDNLSFVVLDLLKDEGWDEAAKGCRYTMHVASPFPIKVSNDRQKLVPAAKDGTLRVLKASINAGVDQIILTSSIVAMLENQIEQVHTLLENDWTDINWEKGVSDYFLSKTVAEKAGGNLWKAKV